jgi:hypothetical protein
LQYIGPGQHILLILFHKYHPHHFVQVIPQINPFFPLSGKKCTLIAFDDLFRNPNCLNIAKGTKCNWAFFAFFFASLRLTTFCKPKLLVIAKVTKGNAEISKQYLGALCVRFSLCALR